MTRVCYFGFGEIGSYCMKSLVKAGCEVMGVFCRETDRQIDSSNPSVFTLAHELGIPCYEALSPKDKGFLEELRKVPPDYVISIQYDRIFKPSFLEIPRRGSLNLHFSPLPRLRGCFRTKWAIINNESSGVTLHHILPGVDDGNIIDQEIIELAEDETDETLYKRLIDIGKRIFDKNVSLIAEASVPEGVLQRVKDSSYYPKGIPFNGTIDWTQSASWIERFIRAFTFSPYPAARTSLAGLSIEILAPVKTDEAKNFLSPGSFEQDVLGALHVSCGEGILIIDRFMLDSKQLGTKELMELSRGVSQFQ